MPFNIVAAGVPFLRHRLKELGNGAELLGYVRYEAGWQSLMPVSADG